MKHILHILLLMAFVNTSGQIVNTVYDTISVSDAIYYEGQKIQLGQGTNASKNFSYIQTGKTIDSLIPLPAAWANQVLTIEMVYQNEFGFVIVASPSQKSESAPYILIRVEHALLTKELMKPKAIPKDVAAL